MAGAKMTVGRGVKMTGVKMAAAKMADPHMGGVLPHLGGSLLCGLTPKHVQYPVARIVLPKPAPSVLMVCNEGAGGCSLEICDIVYFIIVEYLFSL